MHSMTTIASLSGKPGSPDPPVRALFENVTLPEVRAAPRIQNAASSGTRIRLQLKKGFYPAVRMSCNLKGKANRLSCRTAYPKITF